MKKYLFLLLISVVTLLSCISESTTNGEIRGTFNIPVPDGVTIDSIASVEVIITYNNISQRKQILQEDIVITNISALDQRVEVVFVFPESADAQLQYTFYLNNGTEAEGVYVVGHSEPIKVPEIAELPISSSTVSASDTFISSETISSSGATSSVAMSSSEEASSSTCTSISVGVDEMCDTRDGRVYKIATINTQVWMAKNLNFKTDSNSYCYNDSSANCDMYGRLYTWDAAMDGFLSSESNPSGVQGVCPVGWHLPSDAEWTELSNYVIENTEGTSTDDIGPYLKANSGWNSEGYGTDYFGFAALPGGYRNSDGTFDYAGAYGYWWSATEYSISTNVWVRHLYYHFDTFFRSSGGKTIGFSVRCIQDTP